MQARAAVEALRAGTVNRAVVKYATFGQRERLERLRRPILDSPEGSVQMLVGGYGTGKSHLCELLAETLEADSFAVARLEMGASHGRAENPRSVVGAVEQALRITVDGRSFYGQDDLAVLLRAIRPGGWRFTRESELLRSVHASLPGRDRLLNRCSAIRAALAHIWERPGFQHFHDLSLHGRVPTDMTAGNKAIAELNWLAHELGCLEIKGLVLLLDEAERAEWADSNYRLERARDLVIGMVTAAANLDTTKLKHHRNQRRPSYRPYAPSRMHVILAFTHRWGLCEEVRHTVAVEPEALDQFERVDRSAIEQHIVRLYQIAYPDAPSRLSAKDRQRTLPTMGDADLRSFVRCVIAALDHRRLRGTGGD